MQRNVTLYDLAATLTKAQKRWLSIRLAQNETLRPEKSLMKEVFETVVRHQPLNDEEFYSHLNGQKKYKDLAQIKRRLTSLILDFLLVEDENPVVSMRRMRTHIETLLQKEIYEPLPDMVESAITFAREHCLHEDVIALMHLLETLSLYSGFLTLSQSRSEIIYRLIQEIRQSHEPGRTEIFYADSLDIALRSDKEGATLLLKDRNLRRSLSALPIFSRVLGYRAILNAHLVLHQWKDICNAVPDLLTLIHSGEGRIHHALQILLPDLLYKWGAVALHSNDVETFRKAQQSLRAGMKKQLGDRSLYFLNYYSLTLTYHLKFEDPSKAQVTANTILEELKNEGFSHQIKIPPHLFGIFAAHYFIRQDWSNTIRYCMRYLTACLGRYESRMTFWIMKVICHYEARQFDLLTPVSKEAVSDLGKKNLGPVEILFFDCFKGVTLRTSPALIEAKITESAPLIIRHLSEHRYAAMIHSMSLSNWLEMKAVKS